MGILIVSYDFCSAKFHANKTSLQFDNLVDTKVSCLNLIFRIDHNRHWPIVGQTDFHIGTKLACLNGLT